MNAPPIKQMPPDAPTLTQAVLVQYLAAMDAAPNAVVYTFYGLRGEGRPG